MTGAWMVRRGPGAEMQRDVEGHRFTAQAYGVGINVAIWVMSH